MYVFLGDARDGCHRDPKKIIAELYVNWGRASAQQLKGVFADSDGGNAHLLNYVDEAFGQREVCKAFDTVPRALIA